MELTKAEKDKRKLVKDRYIYVLKKVPARDISSWQFIFGRKVGQCCATVQISPTDEFAEKGNNQTYTHHKFLDFWIYFFIDRLCICIMK